MSPDLWNQLFPSIPVFLMMCVVVLLAGTIRSFTGFGGGLVLAPLFSLFMKPADLVVVVLVLNFLTSVQSLPGTWRSTSWPLVWSLLIPSLVGVPLGVWLIEVLDPMVIRRVIGIVVAALAVVLLTGWTYNGARGRLQNWIVGATSGGLTSLAGVGGPPLVLYLLSDKSLSPVVIRSFFMMFFAFNQVFTIVFFAYQDLINATQMVYSVSFIPIYVASTVLGTYLFHKALKTRADLIKKVSLWFLLVVGVVTLVV
jgi:uncharacterized membrane protein YfcA